MTGLDNINVMEIAWTGYEGLYPVASFHRGAAELELEDGLLPQSLYRPQSQA